MVEVDTALGVWAAGSAHAFSDVRGPRAGSLHPQRLPEAGTP